MIGSCILGRFSKILNYKRTGQLSSFSFLINHLLDAQGFAFLGYLISSVGPLPDKQLRQFLRMVNIFRGFLPKAAKNQATLSNLLKGNTRGKTLVEWTPAVIQAFETCKESLAEATLLIHFNSGLTLTIFSDASDHAVGAALKQFVDGAWRHSISFRRN